MTWAVRTYPACPGAARVAPLGFLLSSQAAASPCTSCLGCTCNIILAVSTQCSHSYMTVIQWLGKQALQKRLQIFGILLFFSFRCL